MSNNYPDTTRWCEIQICRSTKFLEHHQIWIDDWKIRLGCNRPVIEHSTHGMGMWVKHDVQSIETTGSFVCEGPTIDLPPYRLRKLLPQIVPIYASGWLMSVPDAALLSKHLLKITKNALVVIIPADFKARAQK